MRTWNLNGRPRLLLAVLAGLLLLASTTNGFARTQAFANPEEELAEAEAGIAAAQTDIADAEARMAAAESKRTAAQQKARRAEARAERFDERATAAEDRHQALVDGLVAEHEAATAEIAALEAATAEERDSWQSSRVTNGFLGGLLLVPLLAGLFWKRLKRAAFWEKVFQLENNREWLVVMAPAVVLGLIGGVLASAGGNAVEILGLALVGIGLGSALVVGFCLFRLDPAHQGLRDRFRLPATARRVMRYGLVFVLGLLTLAFLATSADSDAPDPKAPSTETIRLAENDRDAIDASPEVVAARETAERRRSKADRADDQASRLRGSVEPITTALFAAKAEKRRMERSIVRLERRSTRLQEEIEKEQARAARQAEREAQRALEEEQERLEEAPSQAGCDSNYSGCVPPYPPDVNCADVGGPVTVIGSDPHGLDGDNDGIGCE